eukprot:63033-Pyramimonas_sp.AAC.2
MLRSPRFPCCCRAGSIHRLLEAYTKAVDPLKHALFFRIRRALSPRPSREEPSTLGCDTHGASERSL